MLLHSASFLVDMSSCTEHVEKLADDSEVDSLLESVFVTSMHHCSSSSSSANPRLPPWVPGYAGPSSSAMCYTQSTPQIAAPSFQKGEKPTSAEEFGLWGRGSDCTTQCNVVNPTLLFCPPGPEHHGSSQTGGKRHSEDSGNGKSSKVQRQSSH